MPVVLRDLTPGELGAWLDEQQRGYIQERIAAGDSPAEAKDNATRTLLHLFPGGTPVAGQIVGAVMEDGHQVGTLWVGPAGADPQRWWVWDIAIDAAHRGRGLGRATMVLAEDLARAAGAVQIGLNVFGHNSVARHLYASLGYAESAVQMHKVLAEPPPPPEGSVL
jgi:ribosomal protein S18 acetylase RimI-like enzyme